MNYIIKLLAAYAGLFLASWLTPGQAHINTPMSRIAVEAFSRGNFVGPALFPITGVEKQSDLYYTIGKNTWLRGPTSTLRAPKTAPRRVEFDVSTDSYFAHNYALAGENSFEALANADNPIALRQRTVNKVTEDLLLDLELRIKNKVTSISNIGSGVSLTGANKWSDYVNSDPVADVSTGAAFVRGQTGLIINTMVMDWDTYQITRRHPVMLDMYKYTQGGLLNDAELREVFKIDRILVSTGIYNAAVEGATASITNVWGNNCLLAYVDPAAPSLRTVTFGLGYRWTPEGVPAPMQVSVYNDPDPGKRTEVVDVSYYQDEKIVAPQLAYLIGSTL